MPRIKVTIGFTPVLASSQSMILLSSGLTFADDTVILSNLWTELTESVYNKPVLVPNCQFTKVITYFFILLIYVHQCSTNLD
jgi:hypothetical protein